MAGFAAGFIAGGFTYGLLLRWELRAAQVTPAEPEPMPRRWAPLPLTVYNQLVDEIATEIADERIVTQVEPRAFTRIEWTMLTAAQWRALWQSTATTHLAGAGRPFSRAELEQVRDLLIERGVAGWRDQTHRAQGWDLTPAMRRAIVKVTGGASRSPTTRALTPARVQDQAEYMRTGQHARDWELK